MRILGARVQSSPWCCSLARTRNSRTRRLRDRSAQNIASLDIGVFGRCLCVLADVREFVTFATVNLNLGMSEAAWRDVCAFAMNNPLRSSYPRNNVCGCAHTDDGFRLMAHTLKISISTADVGAGGLSFTCAREMSNTILCIYGTARPCAGINYRPKTFIRFGCAWCAKEFNVSRKMKRKEVCGISP